MTITASFHTIQNPVMHSRVLFFCLYGHTWYMRVSKTWYKCVIFEKEDPSLLHLPSMPQNGERKLRIKETIVLPSTLGTKALCTI